MTRNEVYSACETALTKSNCLLLEAATGLGKTAISLKLVNWITSSVYKSHRPKMLLLVAKRVHKQTWKDEIEKWGGINADVTMECYESLHKHTGEFFEFVVMDECHHIASEARMEALKTIRYGYILGLSATIPRKLKQLFKYRYHSEVVSCDIIEAIEDDILPEPEILLFPLMIDNRNYTETWEFYPKASGPIIYAEYRDIKKYKFNKNVHSIISMTQKQKLIEYNNLIEYFKKQTMQKHNPVMERSWLFQAGKRLEFLAEIKLPIIKDILEKLKKERTITFCKTIQQAEQAGKWCIHSKNADADLYYQDFNAKKINHITAVNILNENANLVDCKYAIFCNLSSSDRVYLQRIGRSLRHKAPVIIIPYYQDTREQEVVEKMMEGLDKKFIKVIHSIQEI